MDGMNPVSRNGKQVTQRNASLRIESAIVEIQRAYAWLEEFAVAAGVGAVVVSELLVVLDEVLNNIIRHGRGDRMLDAESIRLDLSIGSEQVELTISDDGPAFDPTIEAVMPGKLSASKTRMGGVGLLFVQSLMDEVHYSRHDGSNRLVLRKRRQAPAT
jgi:serine/threonine-protein kinase RsbW